VQEAISRPLGSIMHFLMMNMAVLRCPGIFQTLRFQTGPRKARRGCTNTGGKSGIDPGGIATLTASH
jgi:hypothetical protein